jgi:fucose 4-O-acetylase-like acetyltransferase
VKIGKSSKFIKYPVIYVKKLIIKARKCPNLNCISIMMSFSTYVTGFFMNFELLPIMQIRKKWG